MATKKTAVAKTVPMDDKDGEIITVVTLKEFSDDVYSTLRKFDFEKIEVGDVEGTPQHIISKADSRLQTIESERAAVKSELRAVAEQWDDEILALKEQLENEKEKNEILSSFVQTKDAYVLEAWVPVDDTEKVEQVVEKSSDGHCAFETIEVEGTDDENVPVLQQNGWYSKPFEYLVDMYAPVRYNAIDPTIFVAITFPFFFGFCLTDAVYGLIVAAIGVVLLKGLGKVKESMHSFGWILIWSGLWAVILGLITNGCIGDFPERIAGFRLPTVFAPVEAFKHPETILIIAIAVGLLYVNIGFILGAINNLRYGRTKEALGSQICWFVFEAGLIFLVLGYMMPAIGMIGMALGAILTKIAGEYDISLVLIEVGLPIIGVISIILSTWTTNSSNAYSGGLDIVSAFNIPDNRRREVTIIAGVIGTLLGACGILNHIEGFLGMLAFLVCPVGGIMLADYWVIGKGKKENWHSREGIVWPSVIVWAISSFLAYMCGVGYYGIGFSFVLYLLAEKFIPSAKSLSRGGNTNEIYLCFKKWERIKIKINIRRLHGDRKYI